MAPFSFSFDVGLGPNELSLPFQTGLDPKDVSLPLPFDNVLNPIAVSRPFECAKGEFFGSGSILTRRLLPKEVLGRCGLGPADGSSVGASGGEPGAKPRRMLSFFEAVVGGVLSLTFTQSVEFAGEDNEV